MALISLTILRKERYVFSDTNTDLLEVLERFCGSLPIIQEPDLNFPAEDDPLFNDKERAGIRGAAELRLGRLQVFYEELQDLEIDWETKTEVNFYLNTYEDELVYSEIDNIPAIDWYRAFTGRKELSTRYCLHLAKRASNLPYKPLAAPTLT